MRMEERVCMEISIYSINTTTWRCNLVSTFSVILNLSSHIFYIIGVFPLSQHLKKKTGKSVLAKWEISTGKVQVENKRI